MLSAKFPACCDALDKQHAALGHRKSFIAIPKPSEVAYMVYLEGVSKLAEWMIVSLNRDSNMDSNIVRSLLRAAAAAADPAKGRLQHRGKLRGPPKITVTH